MVRKCMVLWCKSQTPHFFRLTFERRESWMRALGRDPKVETLTVENSVCSAHFIESDFILTGTGKRLKKNAVPTINLGPRKPLLLCTNVISNVVESIDRPSTSGLYEKNKENEAAAISKTAYVPVLERNALSNSVISGITPLSEVTLESDYLVPKDVAQFINIPCTIRPSPSSSNITSSPDTRSPLSLLKRKYNIGTSSSDSEGYKGGMKKIRKDVKTFHNYSTMPKDLKKGMEQEKNTKLKLQVQLKRKKEQVLRLKKKVRHLKDVIWYLKKNNIVSDSASTTLQKTLVDVPQAIMKRYIENSRQILKNKKQIRTKFPEELRSFALTLQFYSSKAYNYVRKVFKLALPAPSTIRSWMSKVTCEPGFTECSFQTLRTKIQNNKKEGKETICSFVIDEMSIKKYIEFVNNKTWGYEDIGNGMSDDSLKCATEAFVLLVVAVNDNWKLPIGYFLINSLTGEEKANIVRQALIKLANEGISVVSLTCDGPSAHFKMANTLGASVSNINDIQPSFVHPLNTNKKVYVIFDPCHMAKLLRGAWAESEIFFDYKGRKVDYGLLRKLHILQESEFCKLGNKLGQAHMQWRQQKMKVNLATQAISNSVADALEFLQRDIKHPDFQEADGTIDFIRAFDKAFDLCNSRNPLRRGSKAPLREVNSEYWMCIFTEAMHYCKTLKNQQGRLMHETRKKTPFIGFYVTMMSLKGLFEEYVLKKDSPLKYILSYKFSQDHIELFFSCVRAKNGWNNNPTAYQFYYTYKRLAIKHDLSDISGNCIQDTETHILTTSSSLKKVQPDLDIDNVGLARKYQLDLSDEVIIDDNIEYYIEHLPTLTLLTENVVTYISGFVVKKLKNILHCPECLTSLESIHSFSQDCENFMLLHRKNRGGLLKPSKDVVDICIFAEKKIRFILKLNNEKLPPEPNFFNVFINEVCQELYRKSLFEGLIQHDFDNVLLNSHRLKLIKLILQIFSKIRLYSIAKKQTERARGELLRSKLNRTIIFLHQ